MLSRKTTVPTSTVVRFGSYSSAPVQGEKEIIQQAEVSTVTVRPDGSATAYVSLAVDGMDGRQEATYDFTYAPLGGDIFTQIESYLVDAHGYRRQ